MSDQDSVPSKAESANVPGLLDQYRQQRRAWLAQADELARMREQVRQAAEREALDIVTAARRDVRRIIVEARRELLVLAAQLHAAVEPGEPPGLEAAPVSPLLADPEARSKADAVVGTLDITQDVVRGARKEVRSVLDEARAEIEALTAETPDVFGGAGQEAGAESAEGSSGGADRRSTPATHTHAFASESDSPEEATAEGPVHELNLDEDLAALDFQTRDLPIPTLARILGTEAAPEPPAPKRGDETLYIRQGSSPTPAHETPNLAELRQLLRDPVIDQPPYPDVEDLPLEEPALPPFEITTVSEPLAAAPGNVHGRSDPEDAITDGAFEDQRFTPSSRLFAGEADPRSAARSARAFVGLFAAVGALGLLVTGWWITRDSAASLSAEAPAVVTNAPPTAAADAPPATPAPRPPAGLSLVVEARKPSWIRAQIDGKDEAGRIYQAGEVRRIEATRAVALRAGDAGSVFVAVDGGAPQALGPAGAPLTKQFSASSPVVAAVAANGDTAEAKGPAAIQTSAAVDAAPAKRADGRAPQPVVPPSPGAAPPATVQAPAPATDAGPNGRPDLVQAGQEWLDAYQRRDREAMSVTGTDNITISDERSVTERFPAWQGSVRRELDQVELELTGDTALLTARMTERADSSQAGQHVSRVSQIWVRRNGRWRLADVRIIGEARLNQIVR